MHPFAPQPACPSHPDPETLGAIYCRDCGAWRERASEPLRYLCIECAEPLGGGRLVTSMSVECLGETILVTLHRPCWFKRHGLDEHGDPIEAFLRWRADTGSEGR